MMFQWTGKKCWMNVRLFVFKCWFLFFINSLVFSFAHKKKGCAGMSFMVTFSGLILLTELSCLEVCKRSINNVSCGRKLYHCTPSWGCWCHLPHGSKLHSLCMRVSVLSACPMKVHCCAKLVFTYGKNDYSSRTYFPWVSRNFVTLRIISLVDIRL